MHKCICYIHAIYLLRIYMLYIDTHASIYISPLQGCCVPSPMRRRLQTHTQRGRHGATQYLCGTCPHAADGVAPTRRPSSERSRWAWPCLRSPTRPRCPRVSLTQTNTPIVARAHDTPNYLTPPDPIPSNRPPARCHEHARSCALPPRAARAHSGSPV